MITKTFYHVEPKKDTKLVGWIKFFGVRKLADALGVSPAMISRWARGQTGMSEVLFERAATVIDGAARSVGASVLPRNGRKSKAGPR